MNTKDSNLILTILTLALGVFFLILGIQGIQQYNAPGSDLARGIGELFGRGNTGFLTLAFGILNLISGAILILWPVNLLSSGLKNLALILVFVFWLVNIVFDFILNGNFTPDNLGWYKNLAQSLIILSSLWLIRTQS